VRIDLHTHSTASDGTDRPAELIAAATAAGLDVVALTDHDTTAGWADAAAAVRAGRGRAPTLVPGAEISCRLGSIPIHLLAYLFDSAEPEFAAERELLRDDRVRRARLIVERCRELGAPITWERVLEIAGATRGAEGQAVGRPHVATALVEAGVVATVDDAFTPEWLADGGRAYIDKYALEPVRAIALVRAAGGVTVFAHPGAHRRGRTVTEYDIADLAAAGLTGLEVDHVDHDDATRAELRSLGTDLGLVLTGSSDYHGARKAIPLGAHTTDPREYEALVARATGAQVVAGDSRVL
jgi:3',5'-nucleoside bisphosphate phosphatase